MNLRWLSLGVLGLAAAITGAGYWLRSRRKTPEQRERDRREWLTRSGRITDGTVIDVQEIGGEGKATVHLLIYNYDVAGVSYDASQDITYLRQFIDLQFCRIGLPASIKYDPQNPGNSIVISEQWSGLRDVEVPRLGIDKAAEEEVR